MRELKFNRAVNFAIRENIDQEDCQALIKLVHERDSSVYRSES